MYNCDPNAENQGNRIDKENYNPRKLSKIKRNNESTYLRIKTKNGQLQHFLVELWDSEVKNLKYKFKHKQLYM